MEQTRGAARGGGGEGGEALITRVLRGPPDRRSHRLLLAANYAALFIGSVASTLLTRFYFSHGGSSRWLSTLIQSAGFLLLLPLVFLPAAGPTRPFTSFTQKLISICLGIGILMAINNLLISWGISYLSVSTSSLILSSQLAFNLILSMVLVRQRITFTNLNCVVLLTIASVVLALGASSDRPGGVTQLQFYFGVLATLSAALLFALYLPLVEFVFRLITTYRMVMEMQVVTQAVATAFALLGMTAAGGYTEVRGDSFDLGQKAYWATVAAAVACWQMCFMGTAGMVFLTSSLHSGICMTALLVVNVVGGVAVFGDEFGAQKAVALLLCVWGFASYLYGEFKRKVEEENMEGKEMVRIDNGDGDAV